MRPHTKTLVVGLGNSTGEETKSFPFEAGEREEEDPIVEDVAQEVQVGEDTDAEEDNLDEEQAVDVLEKYIFPNLYEEALAGMMGAF